MPPAPRPRPTLRSDAARRIWLGAQCLDRLARFGAGPAATPAAVTQLGYVQIDTIHVVERSHHHILWTRIPGYERADLHRAQSVDKTVFEYWTHALAFVPTCDFGFYLPAMKHHRAAPAKWFGSVSAADMRKVLALIRENGPLTIRDIDDDVLVDKDHAWASRKPSKRALQLAFYNGDLVVSARAGMLKTYELTDRHFGWEQRPRPATARQVLDYRIDRALRSQGVASLDSICHLQPSLKPAIRPLLDARVRRRHLVELRIEGTGEVPHWAMPETLDTIPEPGPGLVHILSPFDPLVIQRKRLAQFFGYAHRFEAYVPKEKRVLGYFALPVLVGDRIVAALDLKTDRTAGKILIQQWNWVGEGEPSLHEPAIEEALQRFERFQLAK